jgi:hypothetical protein
MEEVKKHVSKGDIKDSYAWASSVISRIVEFHGPDDFYWHGQACCLWHAKAQGWEAYLKSKGLE